MDGFLVVDEDTFASMEPKKQMCAMYSTMHNMCADIKVLKTAHIRWSLIGGVIGGGLVMACMLGIPGVVLKLAVG